MKSSMDHKKQDSWNTIRKIWDLLWIVFQPWSETETNKIVIDIKKRLCMRCRMCWIKFDRIRSLNACCTDRRRPSLRISPSFCCSPEVNIAKNWIWLFAFVLQWCNFSQQCLYIVVIISFVLLKYFLCPYDRLTAPYPLDLFCRSCMYLVWALQRLDPTYLMLLKLLVCLSW